MALHYLFPPHCTADVELHRPLIRLSWENVPQLGSFSILHSSKVKDTGIPNPDHSSFSRTDLLWSIPVYPAPVYPLWVTGWISTAPVQHWGLNQCLLSQAWTLCVPHLLFSSLEQVLSYPGQLEIHSLTHTDPGLVTLPCQLQCSQGHRPAPPGTASLPSSSSSFPTDPLLHQ